MSPLAWPRSNNTRARVLTNSRHRSRVVRSRKIALTNTGRMLMLITAFLLVLPVFCRRSRRRRFKLAAIDLLSQAGRDSDRAGYFRSQRTLQTEAGNYQPAGAPLTDSERAELQRCNIIVGEWVAWLKCAFLSGRPGVPYFWRARRSVQHERHGGAGDLDGASTGRRALFSARVRSTCPRVRRFLACAGA